ncbi:hypothetical protein CapIbe_010469 [Capra ibex]
MDLAPHADASGPSCPDRGPRTPSPLLSPPPLSSWWAWPWGHRAVIPSAFGPRFSPTASTPLLPAPTFGLCMDQGPEHCLA